MEDDSYGLQIPMEGPANNLNPNRPRRFRCPPSRGFADGGLARAVRLGVLAGVLCLCLPRLTAAQASSLTTPKHFAWNDGKLSVRGRQMAVQGLLERISRSAGVEIFLFTPIVQAEVDLDLEARPLNEALAKILRGSSYAVVHGDSGPLTVAAVHFMTGQGFSEELPDRSAAYGSQPPRAAVRKKAGGPPSPGARAVILPGPGSQIGRFSILADATSPGTPRSAAAEGGRSSRASDPAAGPGGGFADEFGVEAEDSSGSGQASASALPGDSMGQGPFNGPAAGIQAAGDGGDPEDDSSSPPGPPDTIPQTAEYGIPEQIAYLEKRIAMGVSDREYEQWVQVRGSGYVTHDREKVEYLYELLAGSEP